MTQLAKEAELANFVATSSLAIVNDSITHMNSEAEHISMNIDVSQPADHDGIKHKSNITDKQQETLDQVINDTMAQAKLAGGQVMDATDKMVSLAQKYTILGTAECAEKLTDYINAATILKIRLVKCSDNALHSDNPYESVLANYAGTIDKVGMAASTAVGYTIDALGTIGCLYLKGQSFVDQICARWYQFKAQLICSLSTELMNINRDIFLYMTTRRNKFANNPMITRMADNPYLPENQTRIRVHRKRSDGHSAWSNRVVDWVPSNSRTRSKIVARHNIRPSGTQSSPLVLYEHTKYSNSGFGRKIRSSNNGRQKFSKYSWDGSSMYKYGLH